MGRFPSCSICYDSFRDFADIAACACGHTFHRDCIVEWRDRCRSRGQSPICPTCKKPFDDEPASGLIPKLFFSFDVNTGPISFDDEYLAKQIHLNEKLIGEAELREAEINKLRQRLERSETQLKIQEAEGLSRIKELGDEKEEAEKSLKRTKLELEALRKKKGFKEHIGNLLKVEKSLARRTEELLGNCRNENSALKGQVDILNELNSALKGQVDILNALVEEMKAAKEEMEGAKADVAKCRVCEAVKSRIYVWDLDYSVRESDLQKRFSKWSPKDITIHYDRHDRSSAAADIVFGNSLDAKEAFERNDDTLFFGTYIKIAHATALKEIEAAFEESSYSSDHEYESEAEEPNGWRIFVSNIKFGVISSKVEEFFSECGDVKSVLLHQDAKGRSLGRADVVFWARQDAEVALGYDGFNLFGRPLRIEKSNLRRNPKSH